jgi:hydrogenase maturation protease
VPTGLNSPITPITVLGIGNILMQDEGIGVRVMEALRDSRLWPGHVQFIDGGVGGLGLLNIIESARRLLVIDAAQMGLSTGEFRFIGAEQIADADDSHQLSLHDVPFVQTLALCRQFLGAPTEVRIMAIQPGGVAQGAKLSAALSAALPALVQAAGVALEDMIRKQEQ